jgi:hypothetical protein
MLRRRRGITCRREPPVLLSGCCKRLGAPRRRGQGLQVVQPVLQVILTVQRRQPRLPFQRHLPLPGLQPCHPNCQLRMLHPRLVNDQLVQSNALQQSTCQHVYLLAAVRTSKRTSSTCSMHSSSRYIGMACGDASKPSTLAHTRRSCDTLPPEDDAGAATAAGTAVSAVVTSAKPSWRRQRPRCFHSVFRGGSVRRRLNWEVEPRVSGGPKYLEMCSVLVKNTHLYGQLYRQERLLLFPAPGDRDPLGWDRSR